MATVLPTPRRCSGLPHSANGGAGAGSVTFEYTSMVISTAFRCEICCLVMHVYPDGIKAYSHECHTVYLGRRGKPARKLHFIPMAS